MQSSLCSYAQFTIDDIHVILTIAVQLSGWLVAKVQIGQRNLHAAAAQAGNSHMHDPRSARPPSGSEHACRIVAE